MRFRWRQSAAATRRACGQERGTKSSGKRFVYYGDYGDRVMVLSRRCSHCTQEPRWFWYRLSLVAGCPSSSLPRAPCPSRSISLLLGQLLNDLQLAPDAAVVLSMGCDEYETRGSRGLDTISEARWRSWCCQPAGRCWTIRVARPFALLVCSPRLGDSGG